MPQSACLPGQNKALSNWICISPVWIRRQAGIAALAASDADADADEGSRQNGKGGYRRRCTSGYSLEELVQVMSGEDHQHYCRDVRCLRSGRPRGEEGGCWRQVMEEQLSEYIDR